MARILVVENHKLVRWALTSLLRLCGHDVAQVADGLQALSCFADQPFDAVLMDVYLRRMDGLEACLRLRQEFEVPILLVSSCDDPNMQELALACGADAFLCKPLELEPVLSWIHSAGREGVYHDRARTCCAKAQ
jgi:two-component system response regulator MprA